MKLNIILKFILVVGIPLIMVYLFVGYMQYRSMIGMVEREGSLRAKVSVELTANSIDERLILIGTATRSLAGYAAIDPKSTRRLQAELLRDLINTDMLIASAVIAWGDPRKGGLEGISMTRGDGGLQSDLLSDEMARRLIGDYESLKKNSGGWMAPVRSADGLAHDAALLQPIQLDGTAGGLIMVSLPLEKLQNEAVRSSLSSSRFAINNFHASRNLTLFRNFFAKSRKSTVSISTLSLPFRIRRRAISCSSSAFFFALS